MRTALAILSIVFVFLLTMSIRENLTVRVRGHVTVNGVRREASYIRTYHGYMVWEDMQGRRFTEYGPVRIEYDGCR